MKNYKSSEILEVFDNREITVTETNVHPNIIQLTKIQITQKT